MAGTLNALGLLAVIGVAIFVLIRFGHSTPLRIVPVLTGIGMAVLAFIVGVSFTNHLCYAGQPFTQILFPVLAIGITYPIIEKKKVRRAITGFFFVAIVVLGSQFSAIVHTAGYTGNPVRINHATYVAQQDAIRHVQSETLLKIQDSPELGERIYPAGFVEQSAFYSMLDDEPKLPQHDLTVKVFTFYRCWHTGLTGLYGKRSHATRLWYPGGKLREGILQIAYR